MTHQGVNRKYALPGKKVLPVEQRRSRNCIGGNRLGDNTGPKKNSEPARRAGRAGGNSKHSRLADGTWQTIYREWCAGTPVAEIARRVGVSEVTIHRRRRRDGWSRPDNTDVANAVATANRGGVYPEVHVSDPKPLDLPRERAAATDRHLAQLRRLDAAIHRALEADQDDPKMLQALSVALERVIKTERLALGMDRTDSLRPQVVILAPAKVDLEEWHAAASAIVSDEG